MINDSKVSLVIDSTSRYSDAWPMFFGQLSKYFPPEIKKNLFTDKVPENFTFLTEDIQEINYSNNDSYRNQMVGCLSQINTEYIIYTSEDYILYDYFRVEKLSELTRVLDEDAELSFIKFIKGPEQTSPYKDSRFLHLINPNDANFFAQQASIWKTKDFLSIFKACPSAYGRMEVEPRGSDICRKININKGVQYFEGSEEKKGLCHWSSNVFPIITTAITKGKWNVAEYETELLQLAQEYKIDLSVRGTNAPSYMDYIIKV